MRQGQDHHCATAIYRCNDAHLMRNVHACSDPPWSPNRRCWQHACPDSSAGCMRPPPPHRRWSCAASAWRRSWRTVSLRSDVYAGAVSWQLADHLSSTTCPCWIVVLHLNSWRKVKRVCLLVRSQGMYTASFFHTIQLPKLTGFTLWLSQSALTAHYPRCQRWWAPAPVALHMCVWFSWCGNTSPTPSVPI